MRKDWLKEKTVIEFFLKRGAERHQQEFWLYLPVRHGFLPMNLYRQDGLKEGRKDPSIEIHGARWHRKGNVHIDSYWGYPSSMKQLHEIWNGIRETYGILCQMSWKDENEVRGELERKAKEHKRFTRMMKRLSKKEVKDAK